jgi:hypothetical protein
MKRVRLQGTEKEVKNDIAAKNSQIWRLDEFAAGSARVHKFDFTGSGNPTGKADTPRPQ